MPAENIQVKVFWSRLGTKHRDPHNNSHSQSIADETRHNQTISDTINLAEKDTLHHGVCFSTTYSAFATCRTDHSGICMSWWLANEAMSTTCGRSRPTKTPFGGLKTLFRGSYFANFHQSLVQFCCITPQFPQHADSRLIPYHKNSTKTAHRSLKIRFKK